jgi:hypothetical protein
MEGVKICVREIFVNVYSEDYNPTEIQMTTRSAGFRENQK